MTDSKNDVGDKAEVVGRIAKAWGSAKVPDDRKLGIGGIWEVYNQWPRLWQWLATKGWTYQQVQKTAPSFALGWVLENALTAEAYDWIESIKRAQMVTSLPLLRFFLLCRTLSDQDLTECIWKIWQKGREMTDSRSFETAVQAAGDCLLVIVAVMWIVRPGGFEEAAGQALFVGRTDTTVWHPLPSRRVASTAEEEFSDGGALTPQGKSSVREENKGEEGRVPVKHAGIAIGGNLSVLVSSILVLFVLLGHVRVGGRSGYPRTPGEVGRCWGTP